MRLNNKQIYDYFLKLSNSFNDNQKYIPAKVNFYIQKNKESFAKIAEIIDTTRQNIAQQYGSPSLDNPGFYNIKLENIETAQKELDDLMLIEHDIPILRLKFQDIENLEFTFNQMESILFMIDDNQAE
jgi:hypothetical protein